MAHWRKLFDGKYLGAWDLIDDDDKPIDKVVTIEQVYKGEVTSAQGKAGKGLIKFRNCSRPLIGNPTIMKSIESMYGADYTKWSGKRITLYAATTNSPQGEVPCVRVRPRIPDSKAKEQPPAEREPGAEG